MTDQAERLATYLQERVGDSLRGVRYHTQDSHDVVYLRDDVVESYPPERVERFIDVSRSIEANLDRLDEMGHPNASMHRLDDGLIIQFFADPDHIIFAALDADVGRNFRRFVDDCLAHLD